MTERIGEVVETSTTHFIAQSYEVDRPPSFGSLVMAAQGDTHVFGVVARAETSSIEPGRIAVARGQQAASYEEVIQQNPQLRVLFRTLFTAQVVGFRNDAGLHHYLPPQPAPVHAFVYSCDPEEVIALTESLGFLVTLASAQGLEPREELLAALVRQAGLARGGDRDFLVRAGRELSLLLAGEPNQLKAVLERIRP